MRPVTELYDRYPGADIYVVGTGASMRVFPPGFLDDKVTIGLNMAWKVAPVRYGITIGPHLNIPEFMPGEDPKPEITWITKRGKAAAVLSAEQFAHADEHFYFFETDGRPNTRPPGQITDEGRIVEWVRQPTGVKLYQWSSISQTAANLAANMGARNVILVGCDNCSLLDNHHSHQQHTKWLGDDPDDRYEQYYEGLVEVRAALRERGVNLMSMSPFLKLDDPERDFSLLCDELGRPRLLKGRDISDVDDPRRFTAQGGDAGTSRPTIRAGIDRVRSAARRSVERVRAGRL